ncbi:NADH-quinone oxidoreductase subunit L [Saccharicrinis sp. FJH54]|uniref:NADH-quinone oxidoreductase subunit L n=1 Tax=Saccharicrinis sp. FJH54 TaxID=3344665 RepID=UPI0035D3E3C3
MTQDILLFFSVLVLLVPMLSFIINIFFGDRLGRKSGIVGTTILGIDMILAFTLAFNKLFKYADITTVQNRFEWFNLGQLKFDIGIGIDNIAAIMLMVVTLISFLVHLFSTVYMKGDRRYPKFYAYLGLFTFSMLGIVISNNFLMMYIFWELVGISSYLLIGFWYEKDSASNASKKAFITNRIGDLGFFAGIMILFFTYHSFMFEDIFSGIASGHLPFDNPTMLTIAGICIFMGAVGKSAQFPLHVWLPDAMEGPTPVSALIHAATMVAAGVYLVSKAFVMFTADALTVIAVIGAITAFMPATIALVQTDFKKILAYSTISQLGYMIMSLGTGGYTNGFFHLVTHAWFKAALFLAAGSVIHAMHESMHHMHDHHTDPQDINNMGGLRKNMPWTYRTFMVVTLALSGIPFTSGFLSKDGILAGTLAYAKLSGGWHWIIPFLGFAAAGMTAFYMFRLTILAFHGEHKTEVATKVKENNWRIVTPLVILAFLSFWFIYSPNPFNASQGWFEKKIEQPATVVPAEYQFSFLIPEEHHEAEAVHSTGHEVETEETGHQMHEATAAHAGTVTLLQEETHHLHVLAMIISILTAGIGILLAYLIYQFKYISADNLERRYKPVHKFLYNKWYFDELYNATIIGGTMGLSKAFSWFDKNIVDGIVNASSWLTRGFSFLTGLFDNYVVDGIVNLVANATGYAGRLIKKLQTGKVQAYIVFVLMGVLILVYFFI